MNHIDTVRQVYESFGKGDIPAILDRLDENVDWDWWRGLRMEHLS